MKGRPHDEAMAEVYRDDPVMAMDVLNELLAEGCTQTELLVVLRHMAMAQGGISQLAAQSDLNEKTLYRTLSGKGNPRLSSLNAILHALGLRLAVVPLDQALDAETGSQPEPSDTEAAAPCHKPA